MWKSRGSPGPGHAAMGFPGQGRAGIHAREFSTASRGDRGKQNAPGLPGWQFRGVFMGKRAEEQSVPLSGNRE